MRFAPIMAAIAGLSAAASLATAQGRTDSTRIPLDPQVITGTLPNGLRYYVRENHRPEKRAELRLAVNAGSVLEDADQLGLAHFTEHMAFNGTRHFEKEQLTQYMRSIGMRMGPEVNAYTSFDETVYMLEVPTDSAGLLARGFEVLDDWAEGQLFDTTEVRKERGVILEEWRLGQGAYMRIFNKQAPVIFGGSRYADRLAIGTRASIVGFDPKALVRFYRDWYRPDLMAVVAVGDFDGHKVEALIRERFGAIPAAGEARARATFLVPGGDSTRYTVAMDREATQTAVAVLWRLPTDTVRTVADYRHEMVAQLYGQMLSMRLAELAQKADPPFIGAMAIPLSRYRTVHQFLMQAGVKSGGETRALDALLTEAARARRHGFTAGELKRAKAELLRGAEQRHAERERTESAVYASQYVATFLTEMPVAGAAADYAYVQRLLPGITLAEVNGLSPQLVGGNDRIVTVSGPEKADVAVVTPAQLAAVTVAVAGRSIEPYRETVEEGPLVRSLPKAAGVVSDRAIPEIGGRDIRLGNGVRIVLKPTDFKADEIVMNAWSLGGSTLLDERLAPLAGYLPSLAFAGGVGHLSLVDLAKALAGKVANAAPNLTETTQTLPGRSSAKDLETMLQLSYLMLTAPRVDSSAFTSMRTRLRAMLENRAASPQQVFADTLSAILSQHSARRRPVTAALLDSISYGDALAAYRARFAGAGGMTFVLVGNLNVDSVKPLLVKYLGALPPAARRETPADVVPDAPAGVVKTVVRRGVDPKSQVQLVFTGPFEFSFENQVRLSQLVELLNDHLGDVIREELGGTYGIRASAGSNRLPRPRYRLDIMFGCSPDRVDELTARVFKEIEQIRTAGPDTADVRKVKAEARRAREVALKENSWWLGRLYAATMYGFPFARAADASPFIESMSAQTIQDAAKRYLNTQRYVQAVLMPANSVSLR